MKEYKILHVQEEHPRKLTEGNWHSAHDFPWAEQVLKLYAQAGYLTVQMAPDFFPAHPDGRPHHLHGYTFLLEREVCKHNHKVAPSDVDDLNALTSPDYAYLEAERLELERELDLEAFFTLSDPEDHAP